MVFSGLLGSSRERSAKTKRLTSPSSASLSSTYSNDVAVPEYISDDAHLVCLDPEHPDLRELNASLEALAAVFPDIQIEVFREMLSSFDGESRLALVADALLKNRVTWVKGRWRVLEKEQEQGTKPRPNWKSSKGTALVPNSEVFRSCEYKRAVKILAWHEFKGLSRSTIDAVLAESNYSYLLARETLVNLSSKSWRFTISSIFLRRKPVTSSEAENHPLVVWKSSGHGSIIPCLKSTGNPELDRELFTELILPLKQRAQAALEENDRAVAADINSRQAEEENSTHECACCFTSDAFETFTSCSSMGHMICFRCVQHSITEAVFGQGWHGSIDKQTGTLKCPAVDSQTCQSHIPSDHIHRAMLEEKNGAAILHKLEQRLAENNLVSSNLPLIRCPFCSYAEVDDIYLPVDENQLRIRANNIYSLIFILLWIGLVPFLLPVVLVSSFVALLLSSKHTFGDYVMVQFKEAVIRCRRRRRGLKFSCQNPECKRDSCLSCNKEWADIHVCHESSLLALRTQVEQAMSMAIKRVCPRCNTSFVKTSGCNKLTCPCGYKMCYVCRKDIGGNGDGPDVGYRHFCDHFRPEGDPKPCLQCNRCNLWESENTEEILRQAKEEAERNWRESEKRELSGTEMAFLETGVAVQGSKHRVGNVFLRGKWPSIPEIFDTAVETVFV